MPKQHNSQDAKVDFVNLDDVIHSFQPSELNGPYIVNLLDLPSMPTL